MTSTPDSSHSFQTLKANLLRLATSDSTGYVVKRILQALLTLLLT
jgi:hypothetical protein